MKVKSDRSFTFEQEKWLELIRRHLIENLLMEKEDIDSMPIFFQEGVLWGKISVCLLPHIARTLEDGFTAE